MGPLNWTQKHKCVWDGPSSKATGHAPGPRAIGPCRCRTTGQRLGSSRTRTAGHCARQRASPVGTFSKSAILHRFPNFYTLRVEIFRMFFIRLRLRMNPMKHEKFHRNLSARFLEIRKTDTHTDRRSSFMYRLEYRTNLRSVYTRRVCIVLVIRMSKTSPRREKYTLKWHILFWKWTIMHRIPTNN